MRILLVDDNRLFLEALKTILGGEAYIELVGQAHNGEDGLRLATTLNPDLVLTDFDMPGMNGIDLVKALKARNSKMRVIIISFHEELGFRDLAIQAGSEAYVSKKEIRNTLLPLLRKFHDLS